MYNEQHVIHAEVKGAQQMTAGMLVVPGERGPAGPAGPVGPVGPAGEKGDAFTYDDFTPEQLEALRGDTGPVGPVGPAGEKGDAFTYDDFTPEQLEALRGDTGPVGPVGPAGEKGDAFTYDDFTPEQLEALKGEKGDKGDAFTYADFTAAQLEALRGPEGPTGPAGEVESWKYTVKLTKSGWSTSNGVITRTVSVSNVTASNTVIVQAAPAQANWDAYMDAEIRCTAQAAGKLTFVAQSMPTADVTVNVLII